VKGDQKDLGNHAEVQLQSEGDTVYATCYLLNRTNLSLVDFHLPRDYHLSLQRLKVLKVPLFDFHYLTFTVNDCVIAIQSLSYNMSTN